MEKIHRGRAGDSLEFEDGAVLTLKSGATLDLQSGARLLVDGAQPAALTAQLTTITHTAPGTPDYAIQNLTNSSGYGFVTADEGNSVLKVIANLQVRCAEMEARLEAMGSVISN